MRKGKLENFEAPASRIRAAGSALPSDQSRDKKPQRGRSSGPAASKGTAGKVLNRVDASKPPAQFAPLPLQQARVLQQLRDLSLNSDTAITSAPASEVSEALHARAHTAHHKNSLGPNRRTGLLRQRKLQSTRFNSAGNTDSEVESPVSQPPTHKHFSPLILQSELQVQSSSISETEVASTPARSTPQTSLALRESVADSPESIAMSTPACGQAPPSSEESPPVPMSCSTAGAKSTNHSNIKAPSPFGSPMCMSPDTWATPQQLQWELSAESTVTKRVTALSASPQVPPQVPSPTASQLQAANLEFGFDAIKAAGVGSSGAGVKSRLASSTLADQLPESPSSCGDQNRAYGGFDRDAEWMEDLEVTQSQSQSPPPFDEQEGCGSQDALCLTLDSDEEACCPQEDPLGLSAIQPPAVSPRQDQNQTGAPHELSPPCKRTNSSLEHARDAAAAAVSPGKKFCTSRPDALPDKQHTCDPQATDSGTDSVQPGHHVQLKAAHDAYVAALHLGSQLDAAKPDKPQQPHKHSWQPQQQEHQQSHGQVQEGQMQQGLQYQHQCQQPHQGLPQQQQHAHLHHCPLPLPHQQQLITKQQQALAAYQAALGRPVEQPAMHLPQQAPHQLPQQPVVHLPQEVPQQVPRKVPDQAAKHLGLPLPCTSAQAQNVYRAFQWQKDAIDYADGCNRHAAGLPARIPGDQDAIAHHPSSSGEQAADKQQEADGAATLVPEIVKVFCEEAGSDAGYFRQFVAASYGRFWARYAPRLGQRPHCYEVVQGGAPCHLYFDTEFATECNPGVDGEALLDKLLLACMRVFREQFQVDLKPEWVYELDSSHAAKFSRHLILRIPGMSFVNNWAVGHLVSQILAEPEGMEILVRKKSDQAGTQQFTSLVDTAVYTRNRHFRLIWSCKAGKTHVLTPTPRFATAPNFKRSHRELFLDTLICNVEPNAMLLLADIIPTGLSFQSSHHPHILGGSRHVGYVMHGQHEVKVAHKCDAFDSTSVAVLLTQERVQAWAEQAAGHVEEVATFRAGGLQASVRTIAHCGFTGTVAYSLIGPGSHYCEHIGRCHQSNRVFFVVNFLTGMLAQKCHDPDCSHFRSTWTPLPPHMLNLDC
ncbi:TPA: hypothetical protein ACH3X1_009587 [Trebouxia sp. C0004]